MTKRIVVLGLSAIVLAACASEKKAPETTSTVGGKLSVSTFPSAPKSVVAIDQANARTSVPVAADGAFSVKLTRGGHYRLVVALGTSEVPIVFPRNGKLPTVVNVTSGAANVALGAVRHVASAPNGFKTLSNGVDKKECADEKGEVCADDKSDVTCKDGAHDDHADGECENGKDAKTGAPCKDDDAADNADPKGAMAVPEKNAPSDVGGCDDGGDGEENDD